MDLGWWETKALARIDIWSVSQVMSFAWRLMSPTLNRCYFWLVVDLPLWKIWVRQLGWWNSQSMEKLKIKNVPNHQAVLPFQAAWHPWFFTPKKLGLMDVYPALKFDVFKRFWPHTHLTPKVFMLHSPYIVSHIPKWVQKKIYKSLWTMNHG